MIKCLMILANVAQSNAQLAEKFARCRPRDLVNKRVKALRIVRPISAAQSQRDRVYERVKLGVVRKGSFLGAWWHRPNENKMSYRYRERAWLEVKMV
jgi:hypothetical protein